MSTLQRTPPSSTKTNKRLRSGGIDETSQPLTLEAVMKAMNHQFEKTLARIEEINVNISGKIDTVKAELDGKLEAVLNDINTFKADCTEKLKYHEDAVCDLNGRVNVISQEIGCLEYRNELIVSGIPHLKDENLASYFTAMWNQVGLNSENIPLVDMRRLGSTAKSDGLVVLQFALKNKRDEFYSSYLQKRDLKLLHLGINSHRRIYVNENLTVAVRKIKAAALRLKKAGKIASVYTKQGIVIVKRAANQPPTAIHSEEILEHFL